MRINIAGSTAPLSDHVRAYAEYRIFTSVARHGSIVRGVDVAICRNRPDIDQFHCTIAVDLGPSGRLKTQARAGNVSAAIDRAADRAGWLLDRRRREAVSS